MRKYLLLLSLLLLPTISAHAQLGNTYMRQFPGTPTGSCSPLQVAKNTATGALYDCVSGAWTAVVSSSVGLVTNTSSTANVINVRSAPYNALGDTQTASTCTIGTTSPTVNCTGVTFVAGDVGKFMNCGAAISGGIYFSAGATILTFTDATHVNLNSNSLGPGTNATCYWGHSDETAIETAVTAWKAAMKTTPTQQSNVNGLTSVAPCLYFPAGGYLLNGTTSGLIYPASSSNGACVEGDVGSASVLVASDSSANAGAFGFFIGESGNSVNFIIKNLLLDGAYMPIAGSANAVDLTGQHYTENLSVERFNGNYSFNSLGNGYNLNLFTYAGYIGVDCNSCSDEFHGGGSSNNLVNMTVQNTVGPNLGPGPRIIDFFTDECTLASTTCAQFTNARDVWMQGSSFFGLGGGKAVSCDATSDLHFEGGVVGTFGNDANVTALALTNGCRVNATDVRFIGQGTGNSINNTGNTKGGFFDLGGNRAQMMLVSTTGSETSSTATMNVATSPITAGCGSAAPQTVDVSGVTPAGYNGVNMPVTATTGTTIAYTANVTGLGASTGGTIYCNNTGYAGTAPIFPLLNNSITQLGSSQVVNGSVPTGCTITGNGTSTCAFDTGSTNAAGRITITAAGTTTAVGLVSFTFNPSIGTNSSNCSANYLSGTGTWAIGAVAPIFITNTTSGTSFNINNNAVNLTATSTYKVNYTCYGQ